MSLMRMVVEGRSVPGANRASPASPAFLAASHRLLHLRTAVALEVRSDAVAVIRGRRHSCILKRQVLVEWRRRCVRRWHGVGGLKALGVFRWPSSRQG